LNLKSFLKSENKEIVLDLSLFQNFETVKQLNFGNSQHQKAGIIIFRNKLLNYTQEYQFTLLDELTSSLDTGGYLITGIKENIDDYISTRKNLEVISKREKIYCKTKTG